MQAAPCWRVLRAPRFSQRFCGEMLAAGAAQGMNEAAKSMRYLGVLSGVSYVSGIDYFKTINQRVGSLIRREECERMPKNARLAMACVDCDTYVDLLEKGDTAGCSRYLMEDGVDRLVAAGAEVLVIASNTAHLVCDEVAVKHPQLQVLHIADTTAAAIKAAGFTRVGLLGTKPTMEDGSWLKARLAAHGIEVVVPEGEAELRRCYDIICQELSLDLFTEESRAFMVGLARALVAERGAQGVVLGCTEIELLVSAADAPGVVLFASAALHMEAAAKVQVGLLGAAELAPPAGRDTTGV